MPTNKKSNKTEIKIVLTYEQKKDFLKALDTIVKEGAAEYFSGTKVEEN